MAHPRIAAWICFVCLTALLLTGCATEPADAQPAAAPSPVIETIAPAGAAAAASTPQAPDEALADLAAEALPEGPDRLAALDDVRRAEGALLTPEQLAESASTFAEFTGLEGLAASQPELREGDPDFLARTILFVNSGGEQVGMVVATSETDQFYFWVDANGKIVCQPTNETQPIESEECDVAIAQYWDPTQTEQQEQPTESAEVVEQAQSWTVLTQAEITERLLADPKSNAEIREQAEYVLGVDKLSDEAFATKMDGHMVEMTTDVEGKPRTNIVVGVVEGKTDLSQVHAAITAAREQGLNLLGSTLLYVTNDASGVMRIWHTGTVGNNYKMEWLSKSYGGLNTFLGFFSYDSTTGEVHFEDLIQENYITLGMGTRETWGQISSPTLEYRVVYSQDGTSTMLSVNRLGKAYEFVSDSTSPKGYRWTSYATPDTRENGAAETMPSLEKINVVLTELDAITAQSTNPDWYKADLLDYQGSKYLEVQDTRQGRVAYLVYVEVDETTGERQYGPVILLNSSNFDPNSQIELVTAHQPLSDNQLALDIIFRIKQLKLARLMIFNNILVISAKSDLPSTHKSSHTVSDHFGSKVPTNLIHFNLNLLESEPELRSRSALNTVLFETFELLGHEYFAAGAKPPLEGFFFTLNPQANQSLVETDFFAFLHNAHLNALAWLNNNRQLFSETDFQRTIEASQFNIDIFLQRIGTRPEF